MNPFNQIEMHTVLKVKILEEKHVPCPAPIFHIHKATILNQVFLAVSSGISPSI